MFLLCIQRNANSLSDSQVAVKLIGTTQAALMLRADKMGQIGRSQRVDYPQTTGNTERKVGVCHLTYGGGELTKYIRTNMSNRFIWMITQILFLESSPNIDDKLIQA